MTPSWANSTAVALVGALLCGCTAHPGAATGALAAAPVADTPASRLEHLTWNTAWATACGFYYDNAKLKAAYLVYEASAGTPPDQLAKLPASFDRLQASIRAIASAHQDQCTPGRTEKLRADMARYLASDFSPGEAA